MKDLLKIAEENTDSANRIIKDLKIVDTWKKFKADANPVGSLRMGLMMKHLDIDFHIYSKDFSISNSFAAISSFACNSHIKRVAYTNLIDTEEKCLEWHLWYVDDDYREWQIDMIHILRDSRYAGYFERMADRICAVLTPEQKTAILSIKNDVPDDVHIMGVEIYKAVIRDGIRSYKDFSEWYKENKAEGIVEWMP